MRESRNHEKIYYFVAEQLQVSLFVTILLQVQDKYPYIANSIQNISHNPFVLTAAETVVLFAKHQTLSGHFWRVYLYVKSKMRYKGENSSQPMMHAVLLLSAHSIDPC